MRITIHSWSILYSNYSTLVAISEKLPRGREGWHRCHWTYINIYIWVLSNARFCKQITEQNHDPNCLFVSLCLTLLLRFPQKTVIRILLKRDPTYWYFTDLESNDTLDLAPPRSPVTTRIIMIPPGKDGWLATPLSLGLSWPLTFRHRTWEWRSPSILSLQCTPPKK